MEKTPARIFITGSTGFIGQHFLTRLKSWQENASVYVLVRKEIVFDDPRIIPLQGDMLAIERYKEIMQSCDYIFHLAANVNFFGNSADDDKVNYYSTKAIIDILKQESNLKNFIFVSTIGAVDRQKNDNCSEPLTMNSIPSPRSQYGKSKLKSEEYIRQSGLPFTIIRPTWVYGENMRVNSHINKFVSMVYGKSPITRFNFPGRVSLIYVGDLVSTLVSCIGNTAIIGKTYFATTEFKSIGEIFKIIYKEIFNSDIKQSNILGFLPKIVKKIHIKIPLTLANLFVDYLYADGKAYINDFAIEKPVKFVDSVKEVVDSNSSFFRQVEKYRQIGFGFLGTCLKLSLYPMSFLKEILPHQGTVLDFGCGEGMLTNFIAQRLNGIKMIGVDKDAKRIEQAKKAASVNATFFCAAIEDMQITNVQAVIINDVLHHHSTEKQQELIKKALDCLAPNGLLIIKEVDLQDMADRIWTSFWDNLLYPKDTLHFRTPQEWNDLLTGLGCKLIKKYRVKHFWPASRTILVYKK